MIGLMMGLGLSASASLEELTQRNTSLESAPAEFQRLPLKSAPATWQQHWSKQTWPAPELQELRRAPQPTVREKQTADLTQGSRPLARQQAALTEREPQVTERARGYDKQISVPMVARYEEARVFQMGPSAEAMTNLLQTASLRDFNRLQFGKNYSAEPGIPALPAGESSP